MSKKPIADVAFRFVDQAVISIGNFALSLLVARILQPTQFGIYALYFVIITFAFSIQWALIISPMLHALPHVGDEQRPAQFGALLCHSAVIGIVSSGAAILLLHAFSDGVTTLFDDIVLALSFVLIVIQDFTRRLLLATERPRIALSADILRYAVAMVGVITVQNAFPDLTVAQAVAIGGTASFVGTVPAWRLLGACTFRWRSITDRAVRHFEQGRWLLPFVVVQSAIAGAPIYVLTTFDGSAVAGGYRAALYLMAPVISLSEAFETFLPLRASQAAARGGESALQRYLWRWTWPTWVCCAAFVSAIDFWGESLIRLSFGSDYVEYSPLLLPFGIAMIFQLGTYMLNVFLRAAGSSKPILLAEIVAAAVLIAGYAGMPFGAVGQGVAWSAALSQAAKLTILIITSNQLRKNKLSTI